MVFARSSVDMVVAHTFAVAHTLAVGHTFVVGHTLAADHTFAVGHKLAAVHTDHISDAVPIVDCTVEPGNLQLVEHSSYTQIDLRASV
jgi:hypothetical protein